MYAVLHSQLEIVELLLNRGSNIHAKTKIGCTPLMIAAGLGNSRMCTLLLERGADVEASDIQGQKAIHYAVNSGNEQTVRALLKIGADLQSEIEVSKYMHDTGMRIVATTVKTDFISMLYNT
jgi:ankyrin repeat protein